MVIGARSEALIRIYRRLGFDDLLGRRTTACRSRMPAACRTASSRSTSSLPSATGMRRGHDLYPFMVETWHPDIQLFDEPSLTAERRCGVRRGCLSSRRQRWRADQRASSCGELLLREGLGQHLVHAGSQARCGRSAVLVAVSATIGSRAQAQRSFLLADLARRVDPVHHRHAPVHQHQVGPVGLAQRVADRLLAVGHALVAHAQRVEVGADDQRVDLVVLGDQHAARQRRRRRAISAARCSSTRRRRAAAAQ